MADKREASESGNKMPAAASSSSSRAKSKQQRAQQKRPQTLSCKTTAEIHLPPPPPLLVASPSSATISILYLRHIWSMLEPGSLTGMSGLPAGSVYLTRESVHKFSSAARVRLTTQTSVWSHHRTAASTSARSSHPWPHSLLPSPPSCPRRPTPVDALPTACSTTRSHIPRYQIIRPS